jgi:hypothetical protein
VHRFATLDALLSMIYGYVRWCLLVAARGRFPTSLVLAKHDRTIAGGVLGGDAAWLLECVPKKVTMLALEKASCVALGQRVHDPLVSLADLSWFQGGLANCKAHNGLSWFRPLLRGNSPMSTGLILKMNMCYKEVSRELEKFAW